MQLKNFESFTYKNNVFLHQGLAAMKEILTRPDPQNLLELRLVNCTTTSLVTSDLVDYLDICRVHLRSLSLVRMQLSRLNLARLATFVEKSEYLEDLDISWNDLIPLDFVPLLHVVSTNKTLVSLNLSCNSLIDKQD